MIPVIFGTSVLADGVPRWMSCTHVLRPSPAKVALDDSTADDWPKHRTTDDGHGIPDNSCTPLLRGPDIAQNAAGVGDGSRAEKSGEEAGDHDRLQIFGGGSAEREYSGDEVGYKNGRFTPVYFGERCEDKRTKS